MINKIESRAVSVEFRLSNGAEGPRISGYAALFNTSSEDMGGWTEQIDPKAFDNVLATNPDIRALWNHQPDHVLGRTSAKTLTVTADDKGLSYTIIPPDTQLAKDLMVSMRRGDITQSSFSFICARDQWTDNEDGTVTRRILEFADVLDVSPVTFPAYDKASSQVRSMPDSMPVEMRSRFERRDKAKTKTVDGHALTADCFLIVGDPDKTDTWHLPVKFPTKQETEDHLRDALSRFDQVEGVDKDDLDKAWNKLLSLCKDNGIDISDKQKRSLNAGETCTCPCPQCLAGACGICSADPQCTNANRMIQDQYQRRIQILALM